MSNTALDPEAVDPTTKMISLPTRSPQLCIRNLANVVLGMAGVKSAFLFLVALKNQKWFSDRESSFRSMS